MQVLTVMRSNAYGFYVVLLFFLAYLLNQLGRYALPFATQPMAQELHYGEKACLTNEANRTVLNSAWKSTCGQQRNSRFVGVIFFVLVWISACRVQDSSRRDGRAGSPVTGREKRRQKSEAVFRWFYLVMAELLVVSPSFTFRELLCSSCLAAGLDNLTDVCKWDYNGQGQAYQLLIGPIFILIYTSSGIFVGFAADTYNRRNMLAFAIFFWNTMTVLTSLVTNYWQLALTRFGLGLGVAGCNPFALSILTDIMPTTLRAAAFGVYNWGIYVGFSMSFSLGSAVVPALGWRWFFFVCGIPGILIALMVLVTVKEPVRKIGNSTKVAVEIKDFRTLMKEGHSLIHTMVILTRPLLRPAVLILFLAGSVRQAAGYVWGYNTFHYYMGVSKLPEKEARVEILSYMSWIPMVAGCISVLFGGMLTDAVVKRFGLIARLWALMLSQWGAAPFAAMALYLPAPWSYLSLFPAYFISELWIPVCQAVLVELIPANIRTSAIAIYFFWITNIGGNFPMLVPVVKNSFIAAGFTPIDSLRNTLLLFYPGLFLSSGLLFAVTSAFIPRRPPAEELVLVAPVPESIGMLEDEAIEKDRNE